MATFNALETPSINQQYTKDIAQQIKDNFDFFRDPPKAYYAPSVAASNITTSSSSFVDITGFSLNLITQGGLIAVMLSLRIATSTAGTGRLDFTLDGVSISGDNNGIGAVPSHANDYQIPLTIWKILAPAAGTRTVAAQWRVTSGTGTIYPAGLCQMAVWELFLP